METEYTYGWDDCEKKLAVWLVKLAKEDPENAQLLSDLSERVSFGRWRRE